MKLNIKKLSIIIVTLLFIGVIIIIELWKYNIHLKYYFENSNKILEYLDYLKKEQYKLNYLVLKDTFYLYENNDKVMDEINVIENKIDSIKDDKFFKNNFPNTYQKFLDYVNIYEKDKENIYRFFSYNSLIKNATIYLDRILNSSIDVFGDNKQFLQKEIYTIGNVFITKNTFDETFLEKLNINYFKKFKFKNSKKRSMQKLLIQNLTLFKKIFPKYSYYLNKIQHPRSLSELKKVYEIYYKEKNKNIHNVNNVFKFIILMLIGGIFIVILLIYLINKEHNELKKSFITDSLTNIGNREKFNIDVKHYNKPTLYLINIDRFKHINDIYGVEIGDEILKEVANILTNNFKCFKKNVYRLGADDFGILCEGKLNYKEIIDYFKKHPIIINGKDFNISISIGVSEEFPLIETADLALKYAKNNPRITSFEYSKDSNLEKVYKENIERSKILQKAIKNDLIVPVFQPIFYNKNLELCKYEVLARIKTDKGLESIYPYLKIAKQNKLYKEITKAIYKKTYEIFRKRKEEFSLNLSIEDLLEEEIVDLIDVLFNKDRDFAKRATFELLESEAIEDYEIVRKFIKDMKALGVKFAIDDFGSGYSNFEHILNLEIDYIKIDGSLIKRITDKNTKIIVKTINNFAKEMNITTVAEFVSDERIFEVVKELEIDCSQGFYLSKPLEKPF